MRPQQWSTNVGWLIGFICLLSVSCQGRQLNLYNEENTPTDMGPRPMHVLYLDTTDS